MNKIDETNYKTIKNKDDYSSVLSFCSFLFSATFLGLGLYKILIYGNGGNSHKADRNFVLGDEYVDYIINANYATGFFVLATMFTILGCTFLIIKELRNT